MRVKPEHVLEQQRVTAQRWIEEADVQDPLRREQEQGDREHRRRQNQNDTGGVG